MIATSTTKPEKAMPSLFKVQKAGIANYAAFVHCGEAVKIYAVSILDK
jgi:hypothetical protein